MAKYLDSTGLTHFWAKIKSYVATYITNLNLGGTYVAKEDGKGLSTNDYTTAEKNKLAGITAGAEVNVQSDWDQTTTTADDYIKNKPDLAGVATSGSYTDLSNVPITEIQRSALDSTTTPGLYKVVGTTGSTTANSAWISLLLVSDYDFSMIGGSTSHIVTQRLFNGKGSADGNSEERSKVNNGSWSDWTDIYGSDIDDIWTELDKKIEAQTTLAGYGITDAKIQNGTITLGSNTITPITSSSIGTASGVCPLDANSKVPAANLPSYVDDVIEAYARSGQTALSQNWLATGSASGTVITPESGKIYVLMADSGDYAANTQFRWGGTAYVKLNDGGVSAITNAEIDSITSN